MKVGLPDIAALFPAPAEADWRARVDAVLKGADFRKKLVSRTVDGIEIAPLHTASGLAPLVAGAAAGQRWHTSVRVDHPDADTAAALAREDLEGGADMLTLVFPGSRSSRGYGMPCETVADLDAALAGVRLDLIRLRLDPAPAGRLNALLVAALAGKQKLDPARMQIDFGLDPIGSLLSLGQVHWDWAAMAPRLAETVKVLGEQGFAGPFLTVDLRPFHEAGAGEAQELAAALALGVLYLRALEAHGVPLAAAFRAISFVVPADADQFMGMAKLRALRKLWARVAEASEQQPEPAMIHAETSWRMLTRYDAHVNILRNTIGAFAAAVGGADTLTVLPFTQALGLPDAAARRLARNTSIVLMEESNLWRVADPGAGAGGIEALTDALCAKAWALFQEIEGEGGFLVSIVLGRLQARVAASAAGMATAVAARRAPLTGVSEFPHLAEVPPTVLPVAPPRRKPLRPRAKARFGPGTEAVVAALLDGASRADVAPAAAGELRAGALVSRRISEAFEALRDRAEAFLRKRRRRPAVTLVTLGPLADHGPRLQFTRNLFEASGLETVVAPSPLPPAVKTGGRAAPDAGGLFCLVGTDAAYGAEGAAVLRRLKARGRTLWMAGRPGELEAALRKAGAKRFVALGDDMLAVLGEALTLSGA